MTHRLSVRRRFALLLAPLLAALVASPAAAAVFQYHAEFAYTHKDKPRTSEAFFWVPPKADHIRGVIAMGKTLMEREFAQDPVIRAACADAQLAILYTTSGLGSADLQALLDGFAKQSGYAGIAHAPLMFVGHSAGGPAARRLAVRHADRCFGLVQYRGAGPAAASPCPQASPRS